MFLSIFTKEWKREIKKVMGNYRKRKKKKKHRKNKIKHKIKKHKKAHGKKKKKKGEAQKHRHTTNNTNDAHRSLLASLGHQNDAGFAQALTPHGGTYWSSKG